MDRWAEPGASSIVPFSSARFDTYLHKRSSASWTMHCQVHPWVNLTRGTTISFRYAPGYSIADNVLTQARDDDLEPHGD